VWWTWEDWELELDWLALRGVNLPLAWVGQEKILVDIYREIGLTDAEINTFLSGPAFQAWNRFGNIQGSWGGDLPTSWINGQFELQKAIVKRMVELGMTPVLPAFTGFVPTAISRVFPTANVTNGSQWNNFAPKYTEDTFLEPVDPLFTKLQKSFISKQAAAYGNITNIYTLDQYNENNPYSGDLSYLKQVTYNTWQSLKAADSRAIWLMQGWLFYSNSAFWTNDRIESYLGGIENHDDMLVLDLFSESQPQWQRTNSYFGKPWIWCQLHDYGHNMGIYGQVENITNNPIEALANSSSLVGFGLTMEGQEGNEIVYSLLLDQAWSATPIDTKSYFHNWVQRRYAGSGSIPAALYSAWDILRTTAYNNTGFPAVTAVTKSILELSPSTSGLLNRTGHHPTQLTYSEAALRQAWNLFLSAGDSHGILYSNPAFAFDLVDLTRQVLANTFADQYSTLIAAYNTTGPVNSTAIKSQSALMLKLLSDLDTLLATNPSFSLSTWINAARAWAKTTPGHANASLADFYEYEARNQITWWGPNGEISDYASKSWAGLVGEYYKGRWQIFLSYIGTTPVSTYNGTALKTQLKTFEGAWQQKKSSNTPVLAATEAGLRQVIQAARKW
jgi:alpha-N-acetylglucosaminidase